MQVERTLDSFIKIKVKYSSVFYLHMINKQKYSESGMCQDLFVRVEVMFEKLQLLPPGYFCAFLLLFLNKKNKSNTFSGLRRKLTNGLRVTEDMLRCL